MLYNEIQNNTRQEAPLGERIIADMHTHSESSHDSVCKIEDMLKAQIEEGTKIFAVTDHFDTESFSRYDVFTPIVTAHNTVSELNKKYGDSCLTLAGIEISEGFWFPEIRQKALSLADYDVVIGSVHIVRYKELDYAYSRIDFSALDKETVAEYVNAYFDDMLTMIETDDFDILAHLTCPLRYINGKYKIGLDISAYQEKIDTILRKIIEKNIALEVNTSALNVMGEFMPPTSILERYYAMGGYLITLGSDAHRCENASLNFTEAIKAIRDIGFKNIYYYKKRKAYKSEI